MEGVDVCVFARACVRACAGSRGLACAALQVRRMRVESDLWA